MLWMILIYIVGLYTNLFISKTYLLQCVYDVLYGCSYVAIFDFLTFVYLKKSNTLCSMKRANLWDNHAYHVTVLFILHFKEIDYQPQVLKTLFESFHKI